MSILSPIFAIFEFLQLALTSFSAGISSPKSRGYAVDAFREHTVRTIGPVAAIGLIVGTMFAMQAYVLVLTFDIERMMPGTSAHIILNEVGPIFTGLMLSMQAGAYLSAEIATQRQLKEFDAMAVMGLDPIQIVVGPKQVGLSLAAPLLNIVTLLMATLGTMLVCIVYYQFPAAEFLDSYAHRLNLYTFIFGQFKAFIFGMIVASNAIFFGYRSPATLDNLGRVSSLSVVSSITIIFFANFFLNWGWAQ